MSLVVEVKIKDIIAYAGIRMYGEKQGETGDIIELCNCGNRHPTTKLKVSIHIEKLEIVG